MEPGQRDDADPMPAARSPAPPRRSCSTPARFLLTLLWSADPALAARADAAGIDRTGLDLETLGKAERQQGLGTWVSRHRVEDLAALRRVVVRGELFCRVNPIHRESRAEIDRVLEYGVQVLMLPMFTTAAEVETFVELVDRRAKVVPLLEHRRAVDQIERIVRVPGLDCIHVGLTDLALSMKLSNRFALLASPLLDRIAAAVHGAGVRLCVGGIGRAQDDSQPVPTDVIYAQFARLGATGALVSRAFFGADPAAVDVATEVRRCRERMAHWQRQSAAQLDAARADFVRRVGACGEA
jgi:citrate lyase beta subunit